MRKYYEINWIGPYIVIDNNHLFLKDQHFSCLFKILNENTLINRVSLPVMGINYSKSSLTTITFSIT